MKRDWEKRILKWYRKNNRLDKDGWRPAIGMKQVRELIKELK